MESVLQWSTRASKTSYLRICISKQRWCSSFPSTHLVLQSCKSIAYSDNSIILAYFKYTLNYLLSDS